VADLSVVLDELDKRILHELCSGTYSYEDLARACGVTRGTVYRRIENLEKMHVIAKKIMAIPDFERLNLSAICIGVDISYEFTEKAVEAIKALPDVKFLWRTYGEHQIIVVIVCEKGCEGRTITNLQKTISKFHTSMFHVSIGFRWDKTEFTPY
jgi:DNA-binding Lrp family transcriptional regulator